MEITYENIKNLMDKYKLSKNQNPSLVIEIYSVTDSAGKFIISLFSS
jgi:hypothetical protein